HQPQDLELAGRETRGVGPHVLTEASGDAGDPEVTQARANEPGGGCGAERVEDPVAVPRRLRLARLGELECPLVGVAERLPAGGGLLPVPTEARGEGLGARWERGHTVPEP